MTLVRAKIEVTIPRKGPANASQREKAEARFSAQILDAVLRHIDFGGESENMVCGCDMVDDNVFR